MPAAREKSAVMKVDQAASGYRREDGVIQFEDQTDATARRVKGQSAAKAAVKARKPLSDTSSNQAPPLALVKQQTQVATSKPPTIQVMFSPEIGQQQLHETFLSIYAPGTIGSRSSAFRLLRKVVDLAPSQPALADSLSTLALAQIGSLHKDERVCKAAVGSYGQALRSLAVSMSTAMAKGTHTVDDSLLAAASMLVVCEFYDPIKTRGKGWFGHVSGVEQLSLARGPKALRSEFGLMLLVNARHSSLARSLLLRKTDPYASPAWRAAVHRLYYENPRERLVDLTVQVPGLLERYDGLNSTSALALDEADALLADCERLEMELKSWLLGVQANEGSNLYTLAPVDSFKTFAATVPDRTLPTAYRFKDFMIGYFLSQYWVAMHYLRSTMKSLDEYRESLDPDWIPGQVAVTMDELNGYVFDLCRCLPSFTEPDAGTQGHIGTFMPLAVIMMSFRNRQNWRWLKWGLNVKEGIYNKGLQQPHIDEHELPVARTHARGESPFDHSKSTITLDDLADVDLSIDWGTKAPGIAVAVNGLSSASSTDGSLAEDFEDRLDIDSRLINAGYWPTQTQSSSAVGTPYFDSPAF